MKINLYGKGEVEFIDISMESCRTYQFPNNEIITIKFPSWLYVSDNGHRIIDEKGISHYIPKGWLHLWWETFADEPKFVN